MINSAMGPFEANNVINELERQLAAKDAEIERLKNTLHIDQTGLAKGLAAVNKLVDGYWWVTEGRGPYEWNDDKYKDEMRNMLENIRNVATEALSSSGTIAHTVCCGKEPRTVTIEDIGYVKKDQADKEMERLKALCLKQFDDMMDEARKQGVTDEFIAARRPQYIKENNL